MYIQVKRHFAEDLNVWPVIIARLSNFTVFCMICNNTFQVSSNRYPLNGVYVMFADLQWHRNLDRGARVRVHTQRHI